VLDTKKTAFDLGPERKLQFLNPIELSLKRTIQQTCQNANNIKSHERSIRFFLARIEHPIGAPKAIWRQDIFWRRTQKIVGPILHRAFLSFLWAQKPCSRHAYCLQQTSWTCFSTLPMLDNSWILQLANNKESATLQQRRFCEMSMIFMDFPRLWYFPRLVAFDSSTLVDRTNSELGLRNSCVEACLAMWLRK
jgi:hypothetical protein